MNFKIISIPIMLCVFLSSTYAFSQPIEGHKSLFIGHSFFVPIADRFSDLIDIYNGNDENNPIIIDGHIQTTIQQGGLSGCPGNFWNDEGTTVKGRLAKRILRSTDVTLFGMTFHPEGNCAFEDYARWIAYARNYNSGIKVLIGAPWPTHPKSMTPDDYREEFESGLEDFEVTILSRLRSTFDDVGIMIMPYGRAAIELHTLCDAFPGNDCAGILKRFDVAKLQIAQHFGLFKDSLGHSHKKHLRDGMLQTTSALAWLKSIYNINLMTDLEHEMLSYPVWNSEYEVTDPNYNRLIKRVADQAID